MPAMAPTHAALRQSRLAVRRSPRSNHSLARAASWRTRALVCGPGPPPSSYGSTPKRARSSSGRYTRPLQKILAHVAQDIGELQRHAEIVGQSVELGRHSIPRRCETPPARVARSSLPRADSTARGRRSCHTRRRRRPCRRHRPDRRKAVSGSRQTPSPSCRAASTGSSEPVSTASSERADGRQRDTLVVGARSPSATSSMRRAMA